MISFYQKFLSPLLHSFLLPITGSPHACRFTPTCSEYSRQAIEHCGIIAGAGYSLWRILRCNPLSKGGHDPVKKYA